MQRADLECTGESMDESWILPVARWQMAFTLGSHIILACFGVGMPWLLLAAEACWLRTGDRAWRDLARHWSRIFAVLFAVGAVSGTVLSFELGLLWPKFMETFGAVIGLPFTLEGFAFFLEAIFAGLYLYGWDRLSAKAHWWTGVPIAISGVASAWFVVSANAWMNTPTGFRWENGQAVDPQPWAAIFSDATGAQTTHMILAALMVTGFCVASRYAWVLLSCRNEDSQLQRARILRAQRGMWLGLALALPLTPIQGLVGDWSAKVVARTQPVKLAAMEAHFETETQAGLLVGGWPDEQTSQVHFGLKIPGGLSWMAYGDSNAKVIGLNDFPDEDRPPVLVVHLAFQIMVGIGTALILLAAYALWILFKRPKSQVWFWRAVVISGPATILAMEAGWVVTEVGRQPWIAHGYMRTAEAVTQATGIYLVALITLALYAGLFVGTVTVIRLMSRRELERLTATMPSVPGVSNVL